MPFLTCPWCLSPQSVSEDADQYQCYTCYGNVRFFACTECGFKQTVNSRWTAFTCASCGAKVALPHRWSYAASTKAREVQGTGESWPKL